MGYTHYWNRKEKKPIDRNLVSTMVNKTQQILKSTDFFNLCSYESDMVLTPPIIGKDFIRFNGKGESGHETFYLGFMSSDRDFNFCKTAHKNYDFYVCVVLLLLVYYLDDYFFVRSDGFEKPESDYPKFDSNWLEAKILLNQNGLNFEINLTGENGYTNLVVKK